MTACRYALVPSRMRNTVVSTCQASSGFVVRRPSFARSGRIRVRRRRHRRSRTNLDHVVADAMTLP